MFHSKCNIVCMTIWKPILDEFSGPTYHRISAAIGAAVASGDLPAGQRLPTQRELADALGVALTTVTRGYREAERLGLIVGEVGRGTFVRDREGSPEEQPEAVVDLSANSMPPYPQADELIADLGRILTRRNPRVLLDYVPYAGTDHQRRAGAAWMARYGITADPDRVVVTSGVQHAMAVVLATVARPGDTVLVEELTYAGMKCLAQLLGIRLHPLPMDEEGLKPEELEAACRKGDPAALYCIPSLQNPTARVMSQERRLQISQLARRFELPVVEDDSYGFLVPEIEPLSAGLDEAYYLCGASKSLAPALRVGFIRAPARMVGALEAAISGTTYMASALLSDVVAEWIVDGTADRIVDWKRTEVTERQRLAAHSLSDFDYESHPRAQHGWLNLPEPWTSSHLVAQAQLRGVTVSPAERYTVSRDKTPHAIRICVGPPRSRSELKRGLQTLSALLSSQVPPNLATV